MTDNKMPQQTWAIAEIGDELESYWWPHTTDGIAIQLEGDEKVIVDALCKITYLSPFRMALTQETTLLVTDRRIAWVTTDYLPHLHRNGFTAPGLLTATMYNAKSKRRAEKQSTGKAAFGQFRFEWIRALMLRNKKSAFGEGFYVILLVPTYQGLEQVELWSPNVKTGRTIGEGFAEKIATLAIERRIRLAPEIETECVEKLAQVKNHVGDQIKYLKPGDIGWIFPGHISDLIQAAMNQSN